MIDDESTESGSTPEQLELQSTYSRFLRVTQQQASAEKARIFASAASHGKAAYFGGMSQDEIYRALTSNHWPRI